MQSKNSILIIGIFLITFSSLASNRKENIKIKSAIKIESTSQKINYDECSVTASGTATTSDGTTAHLTITVSGPCDASLAQNMRDEIAKLRAQVAQL